MVERNASDLHLTAGSPPVIRVNGQPRAPGDHENLTPEQTPDAPVPDPLDRAAEDPRDAPADRLLALDSRARALPRQHLLSARRPRRRLPADPGQDQDARPARPPGAAQRARRQAARARARHRADRLGQVDDARVAAPPHQPHPARAHPHDRGPDRVPAPARDAASSTSARSARTRRRSPRASARRSARTPT